MGWIDDALRTLAATAGCGYAHGGPTSSEPTAWAALALQAHGQPEAARRHCQWLLERQQPSGMVGPTAAEDSPGWFTAAAVCAWQSALTSAGPAKEATAFDWVKYQQAIERGVAWMLSIAGGTMQEVADVGHNATLVGWPWVESTHSWLEPTALHVLALKMSGHSHHPRTREAVRLLIDRLLSEGGCNYGNTFVLGQELRPHVQPSGIVMLALAGEASSDPRIPATLRYLSENISNQTASASVAYALMGLAAHGQSPAEQEHYLAAAAARTLRRDRSGYKLALLAMAVAGVESLVGAENLQEMSR